MLKKGTVAWKKIYKQYRHVLAFVYFLSTNVTRAWNFKMLRTFKITFFCFESLYEQLAVLPGAVARDCRSQLINYYKFVSPFLYS